MLKSSLMSCVLYLNHQDPNIAIDPKAKEELSALSKQLPTPKAILALSSNWITKNPLIGTTTKRDVLYNCKDYHWSISKLLYPATRAPFLADKVYSLLKQTYPLAGRKETRKLDIAIWGPLRHLYPEAGISVLELSIPRLNQLDDYLQFSQMLTPLLEDNILILCTGNTIQPQTITSEHKKRPTLKPSFPPLSSSLKNSQETLIASLVDNTLKKHIENNIPERGIEPLLPLWISANITSNKSINVIHSEVLPSSYSKTAILFNH